jgi:glycosyltransferase involved in cell wall biosynthesis
VVALLLGLGWFPDQTGGLNRYFRELHEALRDQGLSPRAVVIGPALDVGAEVAVAGSADDPLLSRVRRFTKAAAKQGKHADVVDAHFALYAFVPVVIGALRRKPLVVHFQGPWADESAALGEAGARIALKRTLEKVVYRRATAVVTLSGAFKRMLVERYGVQPWRIEIIPPGVDLTRFSPGDCLGARQALGLDSASTIACSVRRLVPRMGLDVLLRAWSRLDGDRVLLIAGDGPDRVRLEKMSASLGLADSVRFLGTVTEDELVSVYRAADVSVVPSTELEGFGLVVLESLACGTPVVATDVGGLPSALVGLEPRSLVPEGDADGLAKRLTQPLPERAACRTVAERFSWDVCVDRHVNLYERAVRPPRARKLRVVFIDHTATLSGAELALLRLLPYLENVEPHVILAEEGPLVARLLEAGVSVEVLPLVPDVGRLGRERVGNAMLLSRNGLRTAAYSLRLAHRLRQLDPDLVHTNSLKAALYGGFAAKLARVPAVSHVHDRLAEDYLPAEAIRLVQSALKHFPRAVIAPSETVRATLQRDAHVIPWPAAGISAAPHSTQRPFTAGILGRVAPWKGQHVFIEAFGHAFPDGDERALIIGAPMFGSDEAQYLDTLRQAGRDAGLAERLTFTGFVDDVPAELRSLDVLVHASVAPEPFGQVVLEGMAAGLPVVAAAAGGPAEMIEHGTDGLLYPPGDADALARVLRDLAADAGLRQRLGEAARKTAGVYSPETAARCIADVYADVLRRGPA